MAIVFPKNNQIKGVKGSFQQSGATRDVSSSAKKNISTASHTSIFGGLHAKHSPNWVAGVKVSGDISKNDFQSVRFQRNSRTFRMNTGGFGTNIVSKQTVKTDNSFMTGSLIGQIVNGAFGTLNKILDANAATTTKKTDKPSTDGTRDGQSVGNTTTFTGKLTSSKSFTELNNLESEVKTKKEGFQGSYDKLFADGFASLKADGASEALNELGVELDTPSLTLTNNLDMSNIDAAMESIDGDIDKFKNFKANIPAKKTEVTNKKNQAQAKVNDTTVKYDTAKKAYDLKNGELTQAKSDLATANENVTQKTAAVTTAQQEVDNLQYQINGIDTSTPEGQTQKAALDAKLNAAKAKLEAAKREEAEAKRVQQELTGKVAQLEEEVPQLKQEMDAAEQAKKDAGKELETCIKAEKALAGVEKECDQIVESLEDKKAELKDIKKFEEEVKDKKYDLAKEQDKKLGEAVNEYKKVQEEINRLSKDENGGVFDKSDTKRADKLNKLNSKLASLGADINTLISSLSAAGSEPIANNKGETYTIQNLDDAQQLMSGGSSS